MKKLLQLSFFCLLFLQIFETVAQESKTDLRKFDRAYSLFVSGDFYMARYQLTELLKKNANYLDAILLLAETYNKLDSTLAEIKTLEKAGSISNDKLIYFRLGMAAYSVGQYEKAITSLLQISGNYANSERQGEIERVIKNCEFAIEAQKNPVDFEPELLSRNINSNFDEYWPSISVDKNTLVFTRLIKEAPKFPQEDFYISVKDSAGWSLAKPLTEINTNQNEGAQNLSADGKMLFFTACSKFDGKGSCDIYFSRMENGKWSRPKNAGEPVNTRFWESQPSLSSDYRFLYFSSNRPGGKGNKDIWRAPVIGVNADGSFIWGEPENLSDSINTPGNEISPFIHANNKQLYFASDYHTGMGKHDLFVSEFQENGKFSFAKNLGYPVNTYENEQGLTISADGLDAFYASGKNNKTGLDIYRFTLPETVRPNPVSFVKARVLDSQSKKPLKSLVELVDILEDKINPRTFYTDENGELFICLPTGTKYAFNISAPGYLFYSQAFDLSEIRTVYNPYYLTIELSKIELGTEMNLYNIYFDTNSFELLPESEPELKKLSGFMQNNNSIVVQIQGHTDNVGNETHNQILSENRAKAVYSYLLNQGINKERLSFKGFGESKPVAGNDSEDGRKLNRRTTILINGK